MRKRAVDLSLEELAAIGANAALTAAQGAYDAGLPVVGTVDVIQGGRLTSSLVQRRPSGAVTDLAASDGTNDSMSNTSSSGKSAD